MKVRLLKFGSVPSCLVVRLPFLQCGAALPLCRCTVLRSKVLLTRNDAEHTATCNLTSKTSLETESFRPIRGGCDCALRSHSHTRRWLGGAYASTDMDMVLLLRSYYKNNYATNRTHTQRRQQTFVDVESPVLPFSLTGVSHFHQPSPSSPADR